MTQLTCETQSTERNVQQRRSERSPGSDLCPGAARNALGAAPVADMLRFHRRDSSKPRLEMSRSFISGAMQ